MGTSEFNEVFSRNLKRYLQEFDMTQVDLAKKLGVSTTSVSNWCKGFKAPRMDKVDSMCELFNCRRSDLMEVPTDDQQKWYLNEETAKVAQEVFDDPDLRMLFHAARDSKPEDIRLAAEMLKRFKETNPDG